MAKKLISFWINEAEVAGLQAIKAADGIAVSELIRQAIRDFLDRNGVEWRRTDAATPTRRGSSQGGGVP